MIVKAQRVLILEKGLSSNSGYAVVIQVADNKMKTNIPTTYSVVRFSLIQGGVFYITLVIVKIGCVTKLSRRNQKI
jgi:hypothetical protein